MIYSIDREISTNNYRQPDGDLSMESELMGLVFILVNNPYESIIVMDANGIIRFVNRAYEKAYGKKRQDVIGRKMIDINPKTRMYNVLKSGKIEITRSKILKDKGTIVFMIPLKSRGRIIGVMGKIIFIPLRKLKELYERIDCLEDHIDQYKEELGQINSSYYDFNNIIGQSQAIQNSKLLAKRAAQTDSVILILGESGTGKELFAHAIQKSSLRSNKPFVRINCSCIPSELIESELFGYSSGAFSGAMKKGRIGKFELADGGTIFLDEIGDMPLSLQGKLLRVLQEKEIQKVGSNKTKKIDFRLISATNHNLDELVKVGKFRLDLMHRINVISIQLPSLRTINEDINLLSQHFIGQFNEDRESTVESISPDALKLLMNRSWPGNIRELRNVIERAMFNCEGKRIENKHFVIAPEDQDPFTDSLHTCFPVHELATTSKLNLKDVVQEAEKRAIFEVLEFTGNRKKRAAKILGIHRTGLYKKMKLYGLL